MKWEYQKQAEWLDRHAAYTYVKPATTLKAIKQPKVTPLGYQRLNTIQEGTVPVVFADGHVQRLSREAFEKLLKPTRE
jgi:prepilin-type processing-associated H-X9-DG protein